jgi:hypothetical protein
MPPLLKLKSNRSSATVPLPWHRQIVVTEPTEGHGGAAFKLRQQPRWCRPTSQTHALCSSILTGGDVAAAKVEQIVDPVMGGEEALGLAG